NKIGPVPEINESHSIGEIREIIRRKGLSSSSGSILVLSDNGKKLKGIIARSWISETTENENDLIGDYAQKVNSIYADNSLHIAVDFLIKSGQDVLPIVERASRQFVGTISARDILKIYEQQFKDENFKQRHISFRKKTIYKSKNGRKTVLGQTWF
ncbi:MAG: CBS domain-containing protein, partial [Chryseolinea sp.]